MSLLAKKQLLKRIKSQDDDRLVVTPILDESSQFGETGIDVRLGNQFIGFKAENIPALDIRQNLNDEGLRRIQKQLVLPFGEAYILHPQQMVLGATFEYIALPNDMWGTIEGRSSWARIGLVIATANSIEPGFKGCITFELSNLSNVPLHLYPGIRIAQLICMTTSSSAKYTGGKYLHPIGPEFSKIGKDSDIDIFAKKEKDAHITLAE
ncbi:MAG: dCTP deaminase [Salinispira sp.]